MRAVLMAAAVAGVALILVLAMPPLIADEPPDPAAGLVRVRVVVTTKASHLVLTATAGAIATGRAALLAGSASASVDGARCVLDNPTKGEVEVDCQWLLTVGNPRQAVEWTASLDEAGDLVLEVYNANDAGRPRLIDRTTGHGTSVSLKSLGRLLLPGGPLPTGPIDEARVLAFYYPWYLHATWSDPTLIDHPLFRYSTDVQAEVTSEFFDARAAGIDGLVMSWNGVRRPLRLAIAAAHQSGLVVSTLLEMLAARAHTSDPIDPNIVAGWIAQIVDEFGSDAAYLKVAQRPVIFIYAADLLGPDVWRTIVAGLRAGGRNPVLIGEALETPWLEVFDGRFAYSIIGLPPTETRPFDLAHSLAVRAHHLLAPPSGTRRIWAATVSPGFDTLLTSPTHPFLRSRDGGAYYDAQWQAAIDSRPDWVLVTSWNEWFEQTEIEAGERYGDAYVQRTAFWSQRYHCAARTAAERFFAPATDPCRREQ